MPTQFVLTLFVALMIGAAASDVLSYRIPNWLTGLVALLFPAAAIAVAMPFDLMLWNLTAGICILFFGFALFAAGLFGGGDAKLMAAAVLWLGWAGLLPFLVYTALAGGALALAFLGWSIAQMHIEIRGRGDNVPLVRRIVSMKPDLPYGVALAVGACATLPRTWWWAGL
jgi:prepilin peptidase CpaA